MNAFNFSIFSRLSQAKILVVGDVMLDRYWYGDTSRMSPEAPIPIVKIAAESDRVGGAANVARNIAHLGGYVGVLGLAGKDEAAQVLKSSLSQENITSHILYFDELETITKLRVISQHQQVVRLDRETEFHAEAAKALESEFHRVVDQYDCVVFSDYDKGSLQNITNMIAYAKSLKKVVLVDPKKQDLNVYKQADFITPNMKEFILSGGQVKNEVAIAESASALLRAVDVDHMLLTRSEQGSSLISAGNKTDFPAQVLEVNDVTGAGDTVIACLALFISLGARPEEAAYIANVAAGIVVGKLGTASVSVEELIARISSSHLEPALSEPSLCEQQYPSDVFQGIEFARQCGEKIVFTNGCFDILHAGHVRYLQEARALGDRLVVGLNSDASVTRLKGDSRPINCFEDRVSVLNALDCVDWVIPFGDHMDDTPAALITAIQPDYLVKGGDYTYERIVGADIVTKRGGQVEILPFLEGRSTSHIIENL